MGAERALQAIARIERALARIEAARAVPAPVPADTRLEAAHVRLRGKVEAAIADIDALLEAAQA